jgi:NAD(P)-dependent dehydrogenase (short-subunit alcohol dehydrogenase family)
MSFYTGKVSVITGAGSGIGRELARLLAARGARLALSDIDDAGLAATRQVCGNADVGTYRIDVSKREQVFAHADDVMRDFGAADFLFNNAGVTLIATFEHSTIEEIEWLLSINLWGVIYGTKAFLPMMLERRSGCIVNLSSIFGLVGVPTQSAYNMSKFAVRGLTEALWRELEGTGVRAVSVHPGGIRTNIDKAGRMGSNAGDYERQLFATVGSLLVTPPEQCAGDILRGVERGANRILTGKSSRLVELASRLAPRSYGVLFKRLGL